MSVHIDVYGVIIKVNLKKNNSKFARYLKIK